MLITWEEVNEKLANKIPLNPLEEFIYYRTPRFDDGFSEELEAALDYYLQQAIDG